jgi:opacity protein-like surface antigen
MPAPRWTSLLACAAVAALTLPAAAHQGHEHPPQIVDAAGDEVVPVGGTDIVAAVFDTAGTYAKVKKKTVYTPTKLTVEVRYAAPVATDPYVAHVVTFDAGSCGTVYLEVYGTDLTYGDADCLDNSFEFSFQVEDDELRMTLPFGVVGKSLRAGTKLTDLRAYTAVADPAIGFEPVLITMGDERGANDVAKTAKPYVVK